MTWMKHAEHGGIADLPDLPYWRAAGWEPTDERPTEPDRLRDPEPPPAEPAHDTTETPPTVAGSSHFEAESATAAASEES